jgi:hypothetical protein
VALTDVTLSAAALSATAETSRAGDLVLAAHLMGGSRASSAGTFVSSGAIEDAGIVHAAERFPVGGETHVDGAATFTGIRGSLWLVYRGELAPVAPGVLRGCGAWRLAGSDGSYDGLGARGSWSSTLVFSASGLAIDVVFRGRLDAR